MMAGTIQEFIEPRIIEEWSLGFAQGVLLKSVEGHLRTFVPKILVAAVESDTEKEDRKLRRFVLAPMEKFVCAGDPEGVFKSLKENDHPPQLCGHVFKMGEPTYACRDCGMDPTCVLCIQCFQKSQHRTHRYRMSTSGGGGYCDCGDKEAWKSAPYCDNHIQGLIRQQEHDPVAALPQEIKDRSEELFGILLIYILQLLRLQSADALPPSLQPEEPDYSNGYVTMLFNDEVHTFDQVISTLQKAVDCSKKEATNFATLVDREGRTPVKIGNYEECNKVRDIIEKATTRHGGKQLKVLVMKSSVVSHQLFAVKLLGWLQDIISKSDGLRNLFCRVAMDKKFGKSVVENMLLLDTNLWKAARIASRQLFMAGVLLDQVHKKNFAILFTELYPKLIKDFIEDDHDHSVCVVSESVQIFTVPTLARMLITDYDLISVILKAFLEECKPKKRKDGKFSFERTDRNQKFRRAQYMLYDVKYALTCKPTVDEWNDTLRRNFMNGFHVLLELLRCMQGMDSVTRQTSQHLEFEPEWEGAFTLQLRINDTLALFLQWCGADHQLLVEVYKAALMVLHQCKDALGEFRREIINVVGFDASVIKYDVSSQPVSIHLPVSRLLAGLHLCLEKFKLTFFSPEINQSDLSAVDLIEPPLRTFVMIAQTQAGMWRRNGYSLLNQIYFYSNVRCRSEMFDKDVTLLQVGAAMIESNEFIIHLLNKFGLLHWVKAEYDTPAGSSQEDVVRQTIILAEEFLNLLIVLIGERYCTDVGEVMATDMTKREVIHQLCISPMAHSELSKLLSDDDETCFDSVIKDIAEFKKPTGTAKGVFILKQEYYKEYNPYFYHYSRPDQTKSEEQQRKRKKSLNEDSALPPPVPPPFRPSFRPVLNLLNCDVMHHIIKLILRRTSAVRSRSWSENQFEKVLHLIGLALHEDQRSYESGEDSFCFIEKATRGDVSVLNLLESLVGHANLTHDAQKDLLAWVLKTFTAVRKLKDTSLSLETIQATSASQDVKTERERNKKAELAARRRAKLMAQMSAMQKNFIKENAELFESTNTQLPSVASTMDTSEPDGFQVTLGSKRNTGVMTGIIRATCILCQEEQDVSFSERAMVLAAFIQRSTVLSRSRQKSVKKRKEHDPLFMESDLNSGIYTSTCGHVMHSDCWQRLFDSVLSQERRRMFRFRHHPSFDIEKMEFLCPLCESLSNSVIPIIPQLQSLSDNRQEHKDVDLSFNDWVDALQKTVDASVREVVEKEREEESFLLQPCPLPIITKMMADSVAKNFQLLYDYVLEPKVLFSDTIREMIKKFSRDAYSVGLGVNPDDDNPRVPIIVWSTCAYTIQVLEQCIRAERGALFGSMSSRQTDSLAALVRLGAVVSQVIQPDEVRKHCIKLLTVLLPNGDFKPKTPTPCVLELDMFHHLVLLCFSLPILYNEEQWPGIDVLPTAGLSDQHLLELTLTAHVVQVMLSIELDEEECMESDGDEEDEALMRIFNQVRWLAGVTVLSNIDPCRLHSHLRHACTPFLRCAALFFHNMTCVTPPSELQEFTEDQFFTLCRYLSLPAKLSTLFNERGDLIKKLVQSWCGDPRVKEMLSASCRQVVKYPLNVNQLISLPDDYSDIINDASTFRCPQSDDDCRVPTQCLVCGEVLCSQSYCCQTDLDGIIVGAATAHAHTCGAGVGIFLRVRDCQILLLSGRTKGCFFAPPYLDDYGETDQGLRRGNPLHLCVESYKRLHKLWLSHAIPEEITHCLESNTNLMNLDWQQL